MFFFFSPPCVTVELHEAIFDVKHVVGRHYRVLPLLARADDTNGTDESVTFGWLCNPPCAT